MEKITINQGIIDIPRLTDEQLEECVNNGLSFIDEINELIIEDINTKFMRTLLNRIDKSINYIKENLSWANGIDELLNILEGGQNDK